MDIKKSRELFVKKVVETIPSHIKPVDYLMETLDISRVSVYRRLNGELPFSYDEVIILSEKLGFSLDDILYTNTNEEKGIFLFQHYRDTNPQEYFLEVLKSIYQNLKEQNKATNRMAILSINNVWLVYVLGFDHLLKFYYYRWLHQFSFNSYRLVYSEISLSSEIIELSHQIRTEVQLLKNNIFVADKKLFFSIIEDVQYYYRRNLFGEKELLEIKNDLQNLIEYTAAHVAKGRNDAGESRSFYLSSVNLYSNGLYAEYDNSFQSFFYGFNINPFKTNNENICSSHKKWLESIKKYSILMTASNEALQIEFFNKQLGYLADLMDNKDISF